MSNNSQQNKDDKKLVLLDFDHTLFEHLDPFKKYDENSNKVPVHLIPTPLVDFYLEHLDNITVEESSNKKKIIFKTLASNKKNINTYIKLCAYEDFIFTYKSNFNYEYTSYKELKNNYDKHDLDIYKAMDQMSEKNYTKDGKQETIPKLEEFVEARIAKYNSIFYEDGDTSKNVKSITIGYIKNEVIDFINQCISDDNIDICICSNGSYDLIEKILNLIGLNDLDIFVLHKECTEKNHTISCEPKEKEMYGKGVTKTKLFEAIFNKPEYSLDKYSKIILLDDGYKKYEPQLKSVVKNKEIFVPKIGMNEFTITDDIKTNVGLVQTKSGGSRRKMKTKKYKKRKHNTLKKRKYKLKKYKSKKNMN
jgi:hypothetical protein